MSTTTSGSEDREGAVLLKRNGTIAELTLSRPVALNAMTWTMYGQLERYIEELAQDNDVHVIVVRGDGDKAFAAGTDISQFAGFSGDDGVAYEHRIDRVIQAFAELPQPTIAAVSGYAVGGGLMLAAACDLRYAAANAQFGAPMARTLGNCLSYRNYQRLAGAMGPMRAKELLYTARLITAGEAKDYGFLTDVAQNGDVFELVHGIAQRISVNAPLTVRASKAALSGSITDVDAFTEVVRRVYGSRDFAEGVQSYVQKRKPAWCGE